MPVRQGEQFFRLPKILTTKILQGIQQEFVSNCKLLRYYFGKVLSFDEKNNNAHVLETHEGCRHWSLLISCGFQ